MINHARLTNSLVRKDPVDTVHPLVRVHPVTGEKCLFINGEFITKIQGLKEPEQRWLTEFLMNHIITGHDFQARVRWQPKTIVIFDNRCTLRKSQTQINTFMKTPPIHSRKNHKRKTPTNGETPRLSNRRLPRR